MKITNDNDILDILKMIRIINSFFMDKFINDKNYQYHFNKEYENISDNLLKLQFKIIDSQ